MSGAFRGTKNLCPELEQTIVGRHGGFADKVRAKEEWTIPLPAKIDAQKAGPLFCGGITVFNPLVQLEIKPTDRGRRHRYWWFGAHGAAVSPCLGL